MIERLLGNDTNVAALKKSLDASSARIRQIGHRVANAGTPDFAAALEAAQPDAPAVDLEREMVKLADEHLRFEAAVQLLQKQYQQARSSLRSN